jgi:CobQ-like glutamine amidotransferase family enzyme
MLDIIRIHNELLGTYGDRGNADVLAFRAHLNGIPAKVSDISFNDKLPKTADIYLMGGAEDAAQALSLSALKEDGRLAKAVAAGAALFAVCAGFQIIGESFVNGQNEEVAGLGLLDVSTVPGAIRYVGDIKVSSTVIDCELTGFENHGGHTTLGAGVKPFGKVMVGYGNGAGVFDGAINGKVLGTYLHGPVLARNPELADYLLEQVTGAKSLDFQDVLANEYALWRRKVTK